MNVLDRIFGPNTTMAAPRRPNDDELAIQRYQHLLHKTGTDAIEKAHLDAFEMLTPGQLNLIYEDFTTSTSAREHPTHARQMTLATTSPGVESANLGLPTHILANHMENGAISGTLVKKSVAFAIASMAIGAVLCTALTGATAIASAPEPYQAPETGPTVSKMVEEAANSGYFFDEFDF